MWTYNLTLANKIILDKPAIILQQQGLLRLKITMQSEIKTKDTKIKNRNKSGSILLIGKLYFLHINNVLFFFQSLFE
jgi:hypothetical protein